MSDAVDQLRDYWASPEATPAQLAELEIIQQLEAARSVCDQIIGGQVAIDRLPAALRYLDSRVNNANVWVALGWLDDRDEQGAARVTDLQIPHDLQAEAAFLGALLLKPDAIEDSTPLEPADFYSPGHSAIFAAILALRARGETFEVLTVASELRRASELEVAGGEGHLVELVANVPSSRNAAVYANLVKETAVLRALDRTLVEGRLQLRAQATAADALATVRAAVDMVQHDHLPPASSLIHTAADLVRTEFPAPIWVVPGVLPEGLAIFAGKPKIGKSWAALAMAIGVATGGHVLGNIQVEQGGVLYLAMEDQERRMQARVLKVLAGSPAPEALSFAYAWPRLDRGGLDQLDRWLARNPCRLIIVDTLARVRAPQRAKGNGYGEDYESLTGLKAIADRRQLAIVVVHHVRKTDSDDPVDLVSGTLGLTGAADSILVLRRGRSRADATLFATGRDIADQDLALHFDASTALWSMIGAADEYRMSQERLELLKALQDNGPKTINELSRMLRKPYAAAKALLWKMTVDGQVSKAGSRYEVNKGKQGNEVNEVTPEFDLAGIGQDH